MADFPPTDVRILAAQKPVDYYRVLARAFPLAFMGVLVIICLFCAQCAAKREREERKLKAEAKRAKEKRSKDPSEHVPYKSPRWYFLHEKALTDSGRMPSSSSESPPSFDPTPNLSFEYGNSSMVGEVRLDLEATYQEQRETPAQTSTPPFARLRQTPPALFKKEEDQPDISQQDQLVSSRSPSPQTLIRQGKEMRYGTWVREPPSASSSATSSDTSQLSTTLFQMSISDDEARRFREIEEKEIQWILGEKKRLEKEMKEEAAIIRQQIAWTDKDEQDQRGRESRAIDIPPRKRMEEHPVYQKMAIAMAEENNPEFDATTVLNSVWEKGMMEEFLRRYAPVETGAVGGEPVEDFSTLRYVKEDTTKDPPDDDTQQLLPKKHKRSKSRAAEDPSRYYVKKVVPVDEDEAFRGARRKFGARSKADRDLSQYCVPDTDDGGAQHGARRKVPLETGAKSEAAPDESRHHARKVAPEAEASEGLVTEGEASQHHVVRWKSPLETVFTFEAPEPQCKNFSRKKKTSAKTAAKDKANAILFYQQMAGVKPLSVTKAKSDTTQPPIHRPVKRVSGTKGEASQPQSQHHGLEKKSPLETSAKAEASQSQFQHHGPEKKSPLETSAKGETSQSQFQHGAKKKSSLETSAKGEASQPQCQHHGSEKKSPLETSAKGEASQSQFQPGAKKKSSLKTSAKGKTAAVSDDSQPLLLQYGAGKKFPETEARSDVFQPPIHLPVKRVAGAESSQPLLPPHGSGRKVHGKQSVEGKHEGSVDNSSPLFHHYGAGKNYGTMLTEVHPIGVFTKKMHARVPLVKGKEFEERSIAETRKVSSKIAKAVFDIEMKRIEDQMITSLYKSSEKDSEQHVVEIHQEPSSSGLIKKPFPVVEEGKHAVEVHQEPSSSGSIRRKPTSEVEIHQNPSTSGLIRRKPSPAVHEGEHVVETQQEPLSSGLMRRKPSPVVEEGEDFVEVHLEPSSSELIRRKPSVAEDTVIELGSEDTSSSWEDIAHKQKYLWWPGIGDRKKRSKKKKYGKK